MWVKAQAEQVVIDNEELYHMNPADCNAIWRSTGFLVMQASPGTAL